jgi:hypothetical protein
VLVDKERLTFLRQNLREVMEMGRTNASLDMAWIQIGALTAVLEGLLTEIVEEH